MRNIVPIKKIAGDVALTVQHHVGGTLYQNVEMMRLGKEGSKATFHKSQVRLYLYCKTILITGFLVEFYFSKI